MDQADTTLGTTNTYSSKVTIKLNNSSTYWNYITHSYVETLAKISLCFQSN
jgi:hypothetical protein